jgi:hypothetical protein
MPVDIGSGITFCWISVLLDWFLLSAALAVGGLCWLPAKSEQVRNHLFLRLKNVYVQ